MSNLIKNELTKIFHKKSLYIILIITLVFMILSVIIGKVINATVNYLQSIGNEIEIYEMQLKYLEQDGIQEEEKGDYIFFTSMIETLKLKQEYENDSWQAYIIETQAPTIIQNLKLAEGTKEYKNCETQYNNFIERLKNGDWKVFAEEELQVINAEIELGNTPEELILGGDNYYLELEKNVVEWRIEKDIPYGNDSLNNFLMYWQSCKTQMHEFEKQKKLKPLTHSEEYQYQQLVADTALAEFAIENKVEDKIDLNYANNGSELSTNANNDLICVYDNYALFIIIALVIVAGTIVSEEFNKGTIKLLLVRPYKRIKILMAKLIACFIVLAIIFGAVAILQAIIAGINYGFTNYSANSFVYNFNTNTVQSINIFEYLILTIIAKAPMFILMMTLAFMISTVLNNSPVAIALPLVGMLGTEIINQIAYNFEKAKFLMFFVTPNWDLSIYFFGKIPKFEPLSLAFSIAICLIYLVSMIVASAWVFNKRNIKNV